MTPIRLTFLFFCLVLSATVTTQAAEDLLGANDAQLNEVNRFLTLLTEDENDGGDFDSSDGDSDDDQTTSSGFEDGHRNHRIQQVLPKISKNINQVVSKVAVKVVKRVKEARKCLFPVVTKSARILNHLIVGLYKIWENYRRTHLPMLKMPSEIVESVFTGKVDYAALIRAGAQTLSLALKALKGTGAVLKKYVMCRINQTTIPIRH